MYCKDKMEQDVVVITKFLVSKTNALLLKFMFFATIFIFK